MVDGAEETDNAAAGGGTGLAAGHRSVCFGIKTQCSAAVGGAASQRRARVGAAATPSFRHRKRQHAHLSTTVTLSELFNF